MGRQCNYQSCQKLYDDYYTQQVGHGLPVFVGGRSYRGHGFGSLLAGIGRSVIPLLKRGGKALLKEGARTGLQVVSDVASGQRVGASLKRRSAQAGKRMLHNAVNPKRIKTTSKSGRKQTGAGLRKNQQKSKKTKTKKKKQQKKIQHVPDIFG